jgi:hypothetical protein
MKSKAAQTFGIEEQKICGIKRTKKGEVQLWIEKDYNPTHIVEERKRLGRTREQGVDVLMKYRNSWHKAGKLPKKTGRETEEDYQERKAQLLTQRAAELIRTREEEIEVWEGETTEREHRFEIRRKSRKRKKA